MKTEIREFQLHKKTLRDIIERQAGSLEKAVLEAVMNSIEAGGDRIDIDYEGGDESGRGKRLTVTDNGRGIPTRQELIDHFEYFGTPHDASENKKWAQFRMGRGQCFAQGKNVWRTCGWQMETDVRSDFNADRVPRYALSEAKHFDGCRIEIDIYDDKYHGTVERLKALVTEQIEFVSVDVFFNGDKINRDPGGLTWTMEDDDAYYLFGAGQDFLNYNMGVRCKKEPASHVGVVGVIVSKEQLKVNFARNDICEECPIKQRIMAVVKANRVKKTRKAQRRLDAFERVAALRDLRDGYQKYDDLKNAGLFYTSSGRSLTFRDILNCRTPWSFANEGDMIADKLMQSHQAMVLNRRILDELSYTGSEGDFFPWLTRECYSPPSWTKVCGLYKPYEDLRRGHNDTLNFIAREKWTKLEKRLVRVLEGLNCWDGRAIVMGVGESANAWTDGKSYIALEKTFIQRSTFTNLHGAAAFFATMIHEVAHTDSTTEGHYHGEEFYRNFHNLVRYGNVDSESAEFYDAGGQCRFIDIFIRRMKRAVDEEYSAAAILREVKAKARVDKALGNVKVAAEARPKIRAVVKSRKKKRVRSFIHRMPSGAE